MGYSGKCCRLGYWDRCIALQLQTTVHNYQPNLNNTAESQVSVTLEFIQRHMTVCRAYAYAHWQLIIQILHNFTLLIFLHLKRHTVTIKSYYTNPIQLVAAAFRINIVTLQVRQCNDLKQQVKDTNNLAKKITVYVHCTAELQFIQKSDTASHCKLQPAMSLVNHHTLLYCHFVAMLKQQ